MANVNVTVGRFEIRDGSLIGPKEYMEQQGNARLDRMLAGTDEVFNANAWRSPNVETAILVWLQTDYAGWRGQQEAQSWGKRST